MIDPVDQSVAYLEISIGAEHGSCDGVDMQKIRQAVEKDLANGSAPLTEEDADILVMGKEEETEDGDGDCFVPDDYKDRWPFIHAELDNQLC